MIVYCIPVSLCCSCMKKQQFAEINNVPREECGN